MLYTGFGESLMSRFSYLAVRNTAYKVMYDMRKPKKLTNDLTIFEKMTLSGFAGMMGAIASNMFEVTMVRKIGDLGRTAKFQR